MDLQKIVTNKYRLAVVMIISLLVNSVLVGFIIPAESYAATSIEGTVSADIYSQSNEKYNELQKKYNTLQEKYENLEKEHKALLDQLSIEEVKHEPVINLSTNTVTVRTIELKNPNDKPETESVETTEDTTSMEGAVTETPIEPEIAETPATTDDTCLTAYAGVFNGPSGKETYYNLPMDGVIDMMRTKGYSEEEYPYWVREDGCKMFGPYIMVAAELSSRPKGTILETSLGTAIVVDTGDFAKSNKTQIDIATNW